MRLIKINSVLVFITTFLLSLGLHKYYVSVTEINLKNQELQISTKIFTDDLLDVIGINEIDTTSILNYYTKHFLVKIEEKPVELKVLGLEEEEESVYIYATVQKFKPKNSFTLKNTLLIQAHHEQKNIVHFKKETKKESAYLDENKTSHTFLIK